MDKSRADTDAILGNVEWVEVQRTESGRRFSRQIRITSRAVGLAALTALRPREEIAFYDLLTELPREGMAFSEFVTELERDATALLAARNLSVPGEEQPANLVAHYVQRVLGYAHDSAEGLAARTLAEIECMRLAQGERALEAAFDLGRLIQLWHVYATIADDARAGHEATHGSKEEKERRWAGLQREVEEKLRANPHLSLKRAQELIVRERGRRKGASLATFRRRTRDPRA